MSVCVYMVEETRNECLRDEFCAQNTPKLFRAEDHHHVLRHSEKKTPTICTESAWRKLTTNAVYRSSRNTSKHRFRNSLTHREAIR